MTGENKNNEKEGLFKGVFVAYSILILHAVLIGILGLMVFFFGGFVQYMGWIFLGGLAVISGSAYFFYRKIKKEGNNLKEMLRVPLLSGKSVEVSVMGGLASFKVGPSRDRPLLDNNGGASTPLLEDPTKDDLTELKELARLLKDGLITRDEYDLAKHKIFSRDKNGLSGIQ